MVFVIGVDVDKVEGAIGKLRGRIGAAHPDNARTLAEGGHGRHACSIVGFSIPVGGRVAGVVAPAPVVDAVKLPLPAFEYLGSEAASMRTDLGPNSVQAV